MNSIDTNPYDAATVLRPAETPSLCLEDDQTWSLLLDHSAVVILEADQVRAIVDDYLSQIVGGPFELGEIPDEATFTAAANAIALRVRADAAIVEAERRADLEAFARTLRPELAVRVLPQ